MKAKWLVEIGVFDDTEEDLLKTLKKLDIEYNVLKYIPFDDDIAIRALKIYGENECVVFYGSLGFGHKLKKLSWVPGVHMDSKALKCSSYYPVFGRDLVHHHYVMMPYGDLLNHKEFLFNIFSSNMDLPNLFIRPDSNSKEFTGMICTYDTFSDNVKLAGFYDVEPDLMILVSYEVPIQEEYRFVIVDGIPISGSLYRNWDYPEKRQFGHTTRDYVLMNSHSEDKYCTNHDIWDKVKVWARMYNPDRCWTIDIAKLKSGEIKILEIGCFSCAGLYGNDSEDVVNAVSKSALKEWNEYFDPKECDK
jgi:hypothetical protein